MSAERIDVPSIESVDLVTHVLFALRKKVSCWSVHISICILPVAIGVSFNCSTGLKSYQDRTRECIKTVTAFWTFRLTSTLSRMLFTAFHPRRRWDVKRNTHVHACSRRRGLFLVFMSTLNTILGVFKCLRQTTEPRGLSFAIGVSIHC